MIEPWPKNIIDQRAGLFVATLPLDSAERHDAIGANEFTACAHLTGKDFTALAFDDLKRTLRKSLTGASATEDAGVE